MGDPAAPTPTLLEERACQSAGSATRIRSPLTIFQPLGFSWVHRPCRAMTKRALPNLVNVFSAYW
jgi:hypothetical protein